MIARRLFAALVGAGAVVIAIAIAVTGCQGSAAMNDASTPDAAPVFGNSTCGTCVQQACDGQIAACNGDPDCAGYLQCIKSCALGKNGDVDPTCEAACPRGSSSSGASAITWLTQCRTTGAGAKCMACGGAGAEGGLPLTHQICAASMDPNSCYRCEDDHCCDSYAACKANAECGAYRICLQQCNVGVPDEAGAPAPLPDAAASGACDFYCYAKHPNGLTEWAPRITCIGIFCSKECGGNPPACLTCTYAECRDEFAATNSTPDGYLLSACVAGCPTGNVTCAQACFDKYPKLRPLYDALGLCVKARCPVCQ